MVQEFVPLVAPAAELLEGPVAEVDAGVPGLQSAGKNRPHGVVSQVLGTQVVVVANAVANGPRPKLA